MTRRRPAADTGTASSPAPRPKAQGTRAGAQARGHRGRDADRSSQPDAGMGITPATPGATPLWPQLQYTLGAESQRGAQIDNPLFALLQAVRVGGSITAAATRLGRSYRFVWGALREWEAVLGDALIAWVQGQPGRLTPFAERLLWAERRARVRVQPQLEALRADLARMLAEARDERQLLLRVCASHDLALPMLQEVAGQAAELHLDLQFMGSVESLRALNAGRCLVAGFHVPRLRGAAPLFAQAMKPLLQPGQHKLIGCSTRRQGLLMRADLAAVVRGLPDALEAPLRWVNRQPGSGTRLLLEHLLADHRADAVALQRRAVLEENTHVAVAACIASGAADIGPGIEPAALEFGLHFVPLIDEDYFLVCLRQQLADPAVQRLQSLLAGSTWDRLVRRLPGYAPADRPGEVLRMTQALPWWRFATQRRRIDAEAAILRPHMPAD